LRQNIITRDPLAQGANPSNLENPLANTIAAAIDIGGVVLLTAFGEETKSRNGKPYKPQLSRPVSSISEAADFYSEVPTGWNIYYSACVRKRDAERWDKDSVLAIPHFWVEIDFNETPETEAGKRISGFPLPPSAIIHSGGGLHCYWILREPELVDDPEPLEAVNRGLAEILGGDSGADVTRLLRGAFLPSERNFPDWKKRNRGRRQAPVVVQYWNGARYNPSDFDPYKAETKASNGPLAIGREPKIGKIPARLRRDRNQSPRLQAIWNGEWDDPNKEGRSGHDAALTMALINRGYSDQEIADSLINFPHGKAALRSRRYAETTIRNCRAHWMKTRSIKEIAAHEHVAEIEAEMLARPWAGVASVAWAGRKGERTGTVRLQNCRAVLEAFLKNAFTLKRTFFQWSQRLMAEESGMGRDTVQKAVAYLHWEGFLDITKSDKACVFHIRVPENGLYRTNTSQGSLDLGGVNNWSSSGRFLWTMHLDPGKDPFRHKAFNKSGYLVLTALLRSMEPLTAKQLNEATGIPIRTIRRALNKLVEGKAVAKEGTKYLAIECDLEQAASELREPGAQERQINHHAMERAIYGRWKREEFLAIHSGKEPQRIAAKAVSTPQRAPQVVPKPTEIESIQTTINLVDTDLDYDDPEVRQREKNAFPALRRHVRTKEELVEA